ncbi:MAG: tRNA-specific adenosine deaminase, partial [Actinobacteria bacterium]|nr:tRNA-specific adenosine deaminase [Actinomycetota bacterium]
MGIPVPADVTTDELNQWMTRALEEAQAAEAHGDVPVGAVVIHNGNVIAARHNER